MEFIYSACAWRWRRRRLRTPTPGRFTAELFKLNLYYTSLGCFFLCVSVYVVCLCWHTLSAFVNNNFCARKTLVRHARRMLTHACDMPPVAVAVSAAAAAASQAVHCNAAAPANWAWNGGGRRVAVGGGACIVQRTRNTHYVNMHVLLVTDTHTHKGTRRAVTARNVQACAEIFVKM